MAVILDISFKGDASTKASWITIDDIDVVLGTSGKGPVTVDDDPEHSVSMWWKGDAGATITYSIKQGTDVLASGKSAISSGQKFGYIGGLFKLHIP